MKTLHSSLFTLHSSLYILHSLCRATPDTDNRWRLLSITGPPGEVTAQQLTDAISTALAAAASNSSANTNAVELLDTSSITDPVQLAQANKLNELITALRR